MTWPGWRDWIFSAKTFTAAMLALYIALLFDLPRPYWAMTTVYVVANPLTGATLSKALYRTLGTLLGAGAAVVMVPALVNAPELLILAVAVWTGCLLYFSMLDRTPRSYVFMLAGYTLSLVALPELNTPGAIFEVAVARAEEIIVGIVCASVVGAVVFPFSVGPQVGARASQWLNEAGGWARDILVGGVEPSASLGRQRLASGIGELDMLISQLAHDSGSRGVRHWARALHGRLLLLLPVLSSLADRLHAVRMDGPAMPARLQTLSDEIAAWIAGGDEDEARAERFTAAITALQPERAAMHHWHVMMQASLLARLKELVDLWQDCLVLQRKIAANDDDPVWKPALRHRPLGTSARHYDYGLMLFSAASVVCAAFLAGLIWIASGWTGGAYFMAMTAVACCFFGTLDQPAVPMRVMLIFFAFSQLVAGVYLFGLFPRIHDFELVVMVLAPTFIIGAAFLPHPERTLMMMMLMVNSAASLAMQSRYNMNFVTYMDQGLAVMGGVGFALVWTLVTKPFGAGLVARRLVHAGWRDMAEMAAGTRLHDHATLSSRTVDRLGQLMPRLANGDSEELARVDVLAELRVGYNILALQRDRRILPEPVKQRVNGVLAGVAELFRERLARRSALPATTALRDTIDAALAITLDRARGDAARNTAEALVGLRRALYPQAPGPVAQAPTVLPLLSEAG
ncbi:hypothetical protein CEK62_09070 [Alcanivorax sp. N3-2A]|nr:hypothetical protein CEK62_09070 [Alcanivorax sp. N3-2A]|tara:strand:- start:5005 stop:7062 length:2058 start_codon:yes stop_codon:yes gene_type:complete